MKTYLECWISAARTLFSQALAGGPDLIDMESAPNPLAWRSFVAEITGDLCGRFTVTLDAAIMEFPLLGDGIDQQTGWAELLREVAEASAGELLASSGEVCHVDAFQVVEIAELCGRRLLISSPTGSWSVIVDDKLQSATVGFQLERDVEKRGEAGDPHSISRGVELLLDVELEAALRFGCRELPLGEILKLGPGDVIELDRHVSDPVDLIIGDKIVARGEVVLIKGNFGMRVSEVAAPQKRLESIRCLF